jgi:tetratricopeptide (TPR) repeat protein
LWADSFEREMSGILALQNAVASQVATALALTLLPAEQTRLTSARSVDPEAYEAYLKGSVHWAKLTRSDIDLAEHYFQAALDKDPSYAPIYEGLAFVWMARQQMGILPALEAGPKARAAALRAVALDDSSAEAHFALATVKSWADWDWAGAAIEWRRALALNPHSANTQIYYGHYLANMARVDEAITHGERALELDPYNALIHSLHAGILNYARRWVEAEAAARTALALQPDAPVGHGQLTGALLPQGKMDELIALERQGYAHRRELAVVWEAGLEKGGYREAQSRLADFLAARYLEAEKVSKQTKGAQWIGGLYFRGGKYEQALDWFEKAFENHEGNLPYITRPFFADYLLDNPRYRDLVRRMGLPLPAPPPPGDITLRHE